MKIAQKVFWFFLTIIIVTLSLVGNQIVSYYSQQKFATAVNKIHQLQTKVRQLDQLRFSLFIPGEDFEWSRFKRLVAESSQASSELKSEILKLPPALSEQLEEMDFNLANFGTAFQELAEIRGKIGALESRMRGNISWLYQSKFLEGEDFELLFRLTSYIHHRNFQNLPVIKQSIAHLQTGYADSELNAKLDQLLEWVEAFYLYDLQLNNRKKFAGVAADNFLQLTRQMLNELELVSQSRQRQVSQVTLMISLLGVAAALLYWYRIRVYVRRFLYNQQQVMQVIKTGEGTPQLVKQSSDELGELTSAMQSLSSELQEKEIALQSSEQRYRSLVENLTDWIWEVDPQRRFVFCNQAAETVTGYSADELTGKRYLELSAPCENEQIIEHFSQHFRDQQPFTNIERKVVCANGEIRYLISRGVPLYNSTGEFLGFRGVDRDVTVLVQARDKQDQLEMKLQHAQKMESIGRLAGGVAHDFNNILSAILGYSELTLNRLDAHHPCYRYINEIRNSGNRAAGLTKQLLAFSRKQARTPQQLDIAAELRALQDMLRRLVGEHIDVKLEIVAKQIWPVLIDKSQLEQVIVNLVVNARDAMPKGGQVKINLSNCSPDCKCRVVPNPNLQHKDYVQLLVTDNGCGIPPEQMQKIFDPFFTTKEMDKGTGLGLAMVYGIVTQNKGDIHVTSEVGKGTCFQVMLPRSENDSVSVKQNQPQLALRKGDEKILFVEDEGALRTMHADFLSSLGYQVVTAVDGLDALQKYQQQPDIELLITDVVMPNMGGVELAKKLSAIDSELKILYSSGYTDHELFDEGVLQEGVNFIYKPASPIDIVKMMEKVFVAP